MISSLLFFLGIELYKMFKRMFFRRQTRNSQTAGDESQKQSVSRCVTETSTDADVEKGKF